MSLIGTSTEVHNRQSSRPENQEWVKVNWQSHQKWLEVDGTLTNVIDIGEGPVVVLVHGLGACWQIWLENIVELSKTHRVIALDTPGAARTEPLKGEVTIPAYADFIASLLDKLQIEKASFIGNSMGGLISCEIAIQHPKLVNKLVLANPAGLSTHSMKLTLPAVLGKILYKGTVKAPESHETIVRRTSFIKAAFWLFTYAPEKLPRNTCYEFMRNGGQPGFLDAFDAVMQHSLKGALSQIEAPTLIIWGRNDRVIPVSDANKFAEQIPNSTLEIWDNTGHLSMLEHSERFNKTVESFITS